MGEADQFIKRIFFDETARATGDTAAFAQAPEIATPSLTPDGILTLLAATAVGAELVAPWTLFEYRAVLDFKREADHVDRYVLARVELRRHAAWVHHLERERPKGAAAQPGRYATLVVAPHLPDGSPTHKSSARSPSRRSRRAATPSRRVTSRWCGSPPTTSRSTPHGCRSCGRGAGGRWVRFVRWLAGLRGVAAVGAVRQSHPMGLQITRQLIKTPDERGLEMTRSLLEGYPEVANEIRAHSRRQTTRPELLT